jgi:hypothetical protein
MDGLRQPTQAVLEAAVLPLNYRGMVYKLAGDPGVEPEL